MVPHSLVLLHPAARERGPPVTGERLQPGTTGPDDEDGYHVRTPCGSLMSVSPPSPKEGMHMPRMKKTLMSLGGGTERHELRVEDHLEHPLAAHQR